MKAMTFVVLFAAALFFVSGVQAEEVTAEEFVAQLAATAEAAPAAEPVSELVAVEDVNLDPVFASNTGLLCIDSGISCSSASQCVPVCQPYKCVCRNRTCQYCG